MPGLLRNAGAPKALRDPQLPSNDSGESSGTSWMSDVREAISTHDFLINRYDELYREITQVERELVLVRRVLNRRAPSFRTSGSLSEEDANPDQPAAAALLQELLEDNHDSDDEQEPAPHESQNLDDHESQNLDDHEDTGYDLGDTEDDLENHYQGHIGQRSSRDRDTSQEVDQPTAR